MTSSASLPPVTTPAETVAGLARALADVGERSFYGFVDVPDRERFAEAANAATDWIRAEVDFHGARDGTVHLAVPAVLVDSLVGAFIGDRSGVPFASAIEDLAGEFANMVCGAWLTRAQSDAMFSLGRPGVHRMPVGWTPLHDAGPDDVLALLNDEPIAVWTTEA